MNNLLIVIFNTNVLFSRENVKRSLEQVFWGGFGGDLTTPKVMFETNLSRMEVL